MLPCPQDPKCPMGLEPQEVAELVAICWCYHLHLPVEAAVAADMDFAVAVHIEVAKLLVVHRDSWYHHHTD